MKIIQIEVGYSETVSLPEYRNVRYSETMRVQLDELDNHNTAKIIARESVEKAVHEQIDAVLVANGSAPKYFKGPTFQAMRSETRKIIVVFPNNESIAAPSEHIGGHWYHVFGVSRGLPYDGLMTIMIKHAKSSGYFLLDCSEGWDKVSDLPIQPESTEEREAPF